MKENQSTLYHDIKDYFEGMEDGEKRELPEEIGEEHGHDRREKREVWMMRDLDSLSGKSAGMTWRPLSGVSGALSKGQ